MLIGAAYAAPALTFDRPTASKKDINFMPVQQVIDRPYGKDVVEDYESKDGNYKYHAEIHYATDDNKDGETQMKSSSQMSSFSLQQGEINDLFKKEMSQVDSLFSDMMKIPSIFGSNNVFDRIFSTGAQAEDDQEASGSGPMFFF